MALRHRNFLEFFRNSKTDNHQTSALRACFVYYMRFNNSALLYREAKALKEKGFDVDLIALRNTKKDKIVQSFDGLKLYCIQARPDAEKRMFQYFTRLFSFFFKATILLSVLAIKRKYQLIHITAPPDFMVFTAILPKLLGARIILDIHDISPEFFMEKLQIKESRIVIRIIKFIENISSRFADHVITVTEHWRKKLVSRSVAQSKCSVLLNVPDEDLFKPFSNNKPISNHSFNLFYHGSLEDYFGVDTLLEAMPIIKQHIPNVTLHIYGSGRLKEMFEKFAIDKNFDGAIKFHNKVPFYKLPEILKDAHLGIVPTKNSNFSDDTISMKSLEYISLGIPIVISKTAAHHFYFDSSMVKFFEPDNEDDLARSVISLHKNEEERKILVKNSQLFIEKYGWNQSKKIYFQIIDHLLNGS